MPRLATPWIARPCYDKYKRCPGWAGAGLRYPRIPWCNAGTVLVDYSKPSWWWRFHRCGTCAVVVAPYFIRYLDPSFLRWAFSWRLAAIGSRLRGAWRRNGLEREPSPAVPTIMQCQCGTRAYWFPRTPGICPNPMCGTRWRLRDGS